MLKMCYLNHASSSMQPKNEEKPLKPTPYFFFRTERLDERLKSLIGLELEGVIHFLYGFLHSQGSHKWDEKESYLIYQLWQYVLESAAGNESDTIDQLYKEAVAGVETKARAVYVEGEISSYDKDNFVQIMTEQGCFILQIALWSLCGPQPLDSRSNDQLIGEKKYGDKSIIELIHGYVFSVTRQIPLVVLKELMKQSFFQDVVKEGKLKRPNDLAGMILYDFLIKPVLPDHNHDPVNIISPRRSSLLGFLSHKKNRGWHHREEPTTLLHALWLLLTGPVLGSSSHIEGEDHDEEEGGYLPTYTRTVGSAKELQAAGIRFKSSDEEGMGIKFKKRMLEAHLYLPCINMSSETVYLFKNLLQYEREVVLDINRREISAYIRLMKELIRSGDDIRVLLSGGVIDYDPEYEKQLPENLSKLEVGNSHNLVAIRDQIRRYVRPSMRTKIVNLVVIGVILTLMQTIISVLGYIHPLK